jgi:hypothetical protein
MARVFDTSSERKEIRQRNITNTVEVAKVLEYYPCIIHFSGKASDDVPLFKFIAPCSGFISSIIFDNSRLESFNIIVETIKLEGTIYTSSTTIKGLINSIKDNKVDYGDIITITLPNQKGINADRDILISFIFNMEV